MLIKCTYSTFFRIGALLTKKDMQPSSTVGNYSAARAYRGNAEKDRDKEHYGQEV